jgi:hypothetical protein
MDNRPHKASIHIPDDDSLLHVFHLCSARGRAGEFGRIEIQGRIGKDRTSTRVDLGMKG